MELRLYQATYNPKSPFNLHLPFKNHRSWSCKIWINILQLPTLILNQYKHVLSLADTTFVFQKFKKRYTFDV